MATDAPCHCESSSLRELSTDKIELLMNKMTVTLELENDANLSNIKKVLNNIKGVVKVTLDKKNTTVSKAKANKETEEWISKMKWLSENFNENDLDLTDPRTQYIMR